MFNKQLTGEMDIKVLLILVTCTPILNMTP